MFVPLRIHSVFSKGRGGLTVAEAASWAAERGLPAAALTDIGNVYGWGKWKRAAAGAGIKPLFGCELEIGGRRFVFLVKNREGYWNLMEIFNRKEVRRADGLVALHVPGGKREAAIDGRRDAKRQATGTAGSDADRCRERTEEAAGSRIAGRIAGCEDALRRPLHRRRLLQLPDGGRPWPARSGLPLVWANPLKFIGSPERLILLHAIEKKIPFPPETEKLAGQDRRSSARTRRRWPSRGSARRRRRPSSARSRPPRNAPSPSRTSCRHLPADIFPKTLRETVMARLDRGQGPLLEGTPAGPPRAGRRRELRFRAVLPHRPRRRRVRPPPRHPPQPARLRGLVLPGLPPRRLPRQPRRVRPLLRAFPEQGPARPAGHRHRLRLAAARRGPGLRPRAVRPRRDGGGLRLQPEELRRPLRPLRDRPGLRRPAGRGALHDQARPVLRRARFPEEGRARLGLPRCLEARPPSWTASTPRSRSTWAGSSSRPRRSNATCRSRNRPRGS